MAPLEKTTYKPSFIRVNKKALLFSEIMLDIIRNFIPHEIVTCDSRSPPSMTIIIIEKAING